MRTTKFPYDEQMLTTNYKYCIDIQNGLLSFEKEKDLKD